MGCAASSRLLNHSGLVVESKLSNSIFLEPVPRKQRVLFLSIKDSSGKSFAFENELKNALVGNGEVKITTDPKEATLILQVNVFNLSETVLDDPFTKLGPFGSLGLGAVGGMELTAATGGHKSKHYALGTIIGATTESITESFTKVKKVVLEVDVKLSDKVHDKEYTTRIMTLAQKVNLNIEEAVDSMKQELVSIISNLV